jgi:hypothetical protein
MEVRRRMALWNISTTIPKKRLSSGIAIDSITRTSRGQSGTGTFVLDSYIAPRLDGPGTCPYD